MAEDSESEALRLTRAHGDRGPSLSERMADRLDRMAFSSPFHRLRLKGRFPLKLLAVPVDPVPGDPARGARLKGGRLFRAGYGQAMRDARLDDPAAPEAWHHWVHGWGWLRDLASAGPLEKAHVGHSEALAKRWLTRFHDYDARAWAPDVTGSRILMAIAHAPLLMPGQDHIHRSALLNGIARWGRHLDRAAPRLPDSHAKAEAIAGLLGGALLLPGSDDRQAMGEALLADSLAALLHADGSAVSRSPLDLARLGDLLLTLAAFYEARALKPAPVVVGNLAKIRSALSAIAMGDGLPAPWHGGQPTQAQMARLGARPDTSPVGRRSGFQRLEAGGTRIIVDAGPPPAVRLIDCAHASTLAFTMSDGKRLLIVSCGGERGGDGARGFPPELVMGLRSTAGHSGLTLADTNSTRLSDGGPRRPGGVEEVVVEMRANADGQWLEARHDGYRRRHGMDHLRRLYLSGDGQDLRGEDLLLPQKGGLATLKRGEPLPVAIRFHLAPGVVAAPTQDGLGALLRLPGGRPQQDSGWAFRARFGHAPGTMRIEPSLMIDSEGTSHEIRQILLTTRVEPGTEASIGWSLRRQGKG